MLSTPMWRCDSRGQKKVLAVCARWVAHRGALAFGPALQRDSDPQRRRGLEPSRGVAKRAVAPHLPFWDAPAESWRCAWCGLANAGRSDLLALRGVGLPLALRLALRMRVPTAWARAAAAPDPTCDGADGHRLWCRGQWVWCSLCGGCSRKRLQLLAKPCSRRFALGRAARVNRLWAGLTPVGVRALLSGARPRRVRDVGTAGVCPGWQLWEDGVASLLGAADAGFDVVFPAVAPDGAWPPAVSRGAALVQHWLE